MNKRIVILQNSDEEAESFSAQLGKAFDVEVSTADCDLAFKTVKERTPQFVITAMSLKGSDGIAVIAKVKELSPATKCIVVSMIENGEMIKRAIDAGAIYYMIKPVDFSALIERMNNFGNEERAERKDRVIDERISRIFIGMGIPPHIKGYGYLREGVKLAVSTPEIINCVTKKLYPSIGAKFGTSASKVERAIRHAIEVAWNKGRVDSFNSLFGVRAYSQNEKPTNSEFIALIADRLLLDGIY